MTPSPLASWVRSTAIAAMLVSVFLAALIIGAEEVSALKDWLKATFTHHWLGKGALALVLFAVLSVVFKLKQSEPDLSRLIKWEAAIALLSVLSIAGYFLLHLLKLV